MIQLADTLLSPSESNALQIFFSQLDHMPLDALNLSPEWSMYVPNTIRIPQDPKSELAKATKDLIALDTQLGHITAPSTVSGTLAFTQPRRQHPPRNPPSQILLSNFTPAQPLSSYDWASTSSSDSLGAHLERGGARWTQEEASASPLGQSSNLSTSSSSSALSTITPSPALAPPQGPALALPPSRKRPSPPQALQIITSHDRYPNPASALPHPKRLRISSPDRGGSSNSAPVNQGAPFPFTSSPSSQLLQTQSSSSFATQQPMNGIAPSDTTYSNPVISPTVIGQLSQSEHSPVVPHTQDNANQGQPSSSRPSRTHSASPQAHHHNISQSAQSKPSLLSASQKKANHIQSEQKRRANIRKGYEALCEVVPALRDAILAEEAQCASTGKKRGRGRLLGEDGEKMDGRAGPRSESVVLQKTIEHMTELLNQRSLLLQRLQDSEMALGQGHPAVQASPYSQSSMLHHHQMPGHLHSSRMHHAHSHTGSHLPHANQTTSQQSQMPGMRAWERIWDGGIGLPLNGEFDYQDEDEDGGSDDEGGSLQS